MGENSFISGPFRYLMADKNQLLFLLFMTAGVCSIRQIDPGAN